MPFLVIIDSANPSVIASIAYLHPSASASVTIAIPSAFASATIAIACVVTAIAIVTPIYSASYCCNCNFYC